MAHMEYRYEIYRPLQFPGHMSDLTALCADGWRVHTALPNYGEVYVLLEREVAAPEESSDSKRKPAAKPGPGA